MQNRLPKREPVDSLFTQELPSNLYDVVCAQAELTQNLVSGAGETKLVVNADTLNGGGVSFGQEAAHSFAQTADDGVLFTGDDLTALKQKDWMKTTI